MAKLGYQRLAEMDQQIKKAEAQERELRQKSNEDPSFGPALIKVVRNLDRLKAAQSALRADMHARGEPQEDPRETVKKKYALAERHNYRLSLIPKIVRKAHELQILLADYNNSQVPAPHTYWDGTAIDYIITLESAKFNFTQILKYEKPMTKADFEREMAEAEKQYDKLMADTEAREEVERKVQEFAEGVY